MPRCTDAGSVLIRDIDLLKLRSFAVVHKYVTVTISTVNVLFSL